MVSIFLALNELICLRYSYLRGSETGQRREMRGNRSIKAVTHGRQLVVEWRYAGTVHSGLLLCACGDLIRVPPATCPYICSHFLQPTGKAPHTAKM
jgi:hypothetical protein